MNAEWLIEKCHVETNLYQACQRREILRNDIPFPRSETSLRNSGTCLFTYSFNYRSLLIYISLVDTSLTSLDTKALDLSCLCSRRMVGLITCKSALFMVALGSNS